MLLSQHDDEEDESAADEDDHYKTVMSKPLFNVEDGDEDSENDDEEAKRKGVHWGADVTDHHRNAAPRTQKSVTFGSNNPTAGIVALNMNRTKIGFDNDDYKEIYKGQDTEKVWIDFGKVNSNVLRFEPQKNPNM